MKEEKIISEDLVNIQSAEINGQMKITIMIMKVKKKQKQKTEQEFSKI